MDVFPAFIADYWCGSEIFIGVFDSADHAEDACTLFIKHLKAQHPEMDLEDRYDYYTASFRLNEFNMDAIDALG